jgi:hypothetical protein
MNITGYASVNFGLKQPQQWFAQRQDTDRGEEGGPDGRVHRVAHMSLEAGLVAASFRRREVVRDGTAKREVDAQDRAHGLGGGEIHDLGRTVR